MSGMSPQEVKEMVMVYEALISDYEVAISRAKVIKSDRKRLLFITDAEVSYKSAQAVRAQLSRAGYEIRRSM